MNKDERFIFRADAETRAQLEELAGRFEMSMSEVIRYLISQEYQIVTVPLIGTISSKGITIKEEIERN